MSTSEQDLLARHAERLARLAQREASAWREYLAAARAGDKHGYDRAESFAWRRLKRLLAELSAERRRAQFVLDRGLADRIDGIPKAS